MKAQSPNHRTAREFPPHIFLLLISCLIPLWSENKLYAFNPLKFIESLQFVLPTLWKLLLGSELGITSMLPSFQGLKPSTACCLISGNSCFIQFVSFLVVYNERAIPIAVNPSTAEAEAPLRPFKCLYLWDLILFSFTRARSEHKSSLPLWTSLAADHTVPAA